MRNFLGSMMITSLLLASGCDGSNPDDVLAGDAGAGSKTDSGSAAQTGTCPVPGPGSDINSSNSRQIGVSSFQWSNRLPEQLRHGYRIQGDTLCRHRRQPEDPCQ